MIRIALTVATIIASFVSGWSQAYYEASGQTAVFTLAAGAKAGPLAIRAEQKSRGVTVSGISVTVARNGIVVALPALQRGINDIVIYNAAGRQVFRQHGFSGKTLRLETGVFKPGVYAIRVCVDGQKYVRRFVISGQGK